MPNLNTETANTSTANIKPKRKVLTKKYSFIMALNVLSSIALMTLIKVSIIVNC